MNPTKPSDTNDEQNNEQHTQQSAPQRQPQAVAEPQAASKRDVQEAERKAVEAQRMAAEETESVRQEVQDLREQNQRLREDLDRALAALRHVDVHLTSVEENIGAWGNNYETENIAELAGLPTIEDLETVEGYDPTEQEE